MLWVGVGGARDALASLRRSVEDALASAGVPRDERGFAPHITLGRVHGRLPRTEADALRASVESLPVRAVAFAAEEVGLYHSDLLPGGAVYTRLASARLG